jgi:hypothetical protein
MLRFRDTQTFYAVTIGCFTPVAVKNSKPLRYRREQNQVVPVYGFHVAQAA